MQFCFRILIKFLKFVFGKIYDYQINARKNVDIFDNH